MTLEQLRVFVAVERQHVTPRITKEPQREGQEAGWQNHVYAQGIELNR